MKWISFFLAVLFLSNDAYARDKVVLLTSFHMPLWERASERGLSREFGQFFKNKNFDIKVKHDASAWDLWQALHDPAVRGLFWVSHGTLDSPISPPKIPTWDGHDISPIFSTATPRLRFLSLIGCYSEQLASKMRGLDSGLTVVGFDHKIRARPALREALKQWQWDNEWNDEGQERAASPSKIGSKIRLKVVRTLKERGPPVWIQVNGDALGMFPEGAAGEVQTLELELDLKTERSMSKITVSSGKLIAITSDLPSLGAFDFHQVGSPEKKWKIFADQQGNPIGASENVYRLDASR